MPAPKLRCEPDGMWLEFAFDQAYLKVLGAGQRQTGQVPPEVGRMLLALDGAMSRAAAPITSKRLWPQACWR